MTTIAVLDANVLIPNALCDFLLRLAEEDLYQPRWSPAILDEVRRHVPVPAAAIDRRIAFMNAAFGDALVIADDSLIDQMGNDPKDGFGEAFRLWRETTTRWPHNLRPDLRSGMAATVVVGRGCKNGAIYRRVLRDRKQAHPAAA